jgi:ABC-type nitrate/sulfonate/bicarbonate transport system permease component
MRARLPVDPWALLSIVLVLAGWQLAAWHHNTVLFPGPWRTALAIVENFHLISEELINTLRRAFTAFGLSVLVMVPFGIACGRLRPLGMIVDPILNS